MATTQPGLNTQPHPNTCHPQPTPTPSRPLTPEEGRPHPQPPHADARYPPSPPPHREVEVHGHHGAGLDKSLGQDVLTGAALARGSDRRGQGPRCSLGKRPSRIEGRRHVGWKAAPSRWPSPERGLAGRHPGPAAQGGAGLWRHHWRHGRLQEVGHCGFGGGAAPLAGSMQGRRRLRLPAMP